MTSTLPRLLSMPGKLIMICESALSRYFFGLTVCLILLAATAQARELSFQQALDLADHNATELQSLVAEQALAEAGHLRTARALLPEISADGTWARADSTMINDVKLPTLEIPPRIVSRDFGPVEGSFFALQLVQPLIHVVGWKMRQEAQFAVEARRLAHAWGIELMRLEVARRYFAVVVHGHALEAAGLAMEAAREALRLARAGYDEGMVARVDVLRAQTEFQTNKARRLDAQAGMHKARIHLATLLGLPPEQEIILTSALPVPPVPPAREHAPAKRQDVQAMQARLDAAEAGLDSARARWLPRVSFLARQQWFDGSRPVDTDTQGWLVAMNLRWTLFDGMDRQGEIAQARARRNQARIALEENRREVSQEQSTAISDWHAVWSAWQSSDQGLESAVLAATLSRRQYEEGLGSMTDLLTTQAMLHQRRLEHVRYQYRAFLASMNYYLSHGLDPLTAVPHGAQ